MYLSLIWEPLPEATRQSIISNSTFIPLIIITILYLLPTPRRRPRSGRATPWPQGGSGTRTLLCLTSAFGWGGAGNLDFLKIFTYPGLFSLANVYIWNTSWDDSASNLVQKWISANIYITQIYSPIYDTFLESLGLGEYSRSISRFFRNYQDDQKG